MSKKKTSSGMTAMKDGIGPAAIRRLADGLSAVIPDFPTASFSTKARKPLAQLELKQRALHISTVLAALLPPSFEEVAPLLQALPEHWDSGDADDPLRGFAIWPVMTYVSEAGLDYPKLALPVLKTLTPLFSSEFAIRPFWRDHFDITYTHVEAWCDDPDPHVRRLVSEGIRTRLPWSFQLKALIKDPTPIFGLLEQLKDDESEYVRRSVANNLNDITKDHPDAVIERCQDWLADASDERRWIVRHATRTLVKAGYPGIFGLLGYTSEPLVEVDSLSLEDECVELGDAITFSAVLSASEEANEEQRIVVDYAMYFLKANGQQKPKVFKGKTITLRPGETVTFDKRHPIKAITTRRYYAGEQAIALMINGREQAKQSFWLDLEPSS